MFRRFVPRLGVSLVVASLLVGVIAAPVGAAHQTRWVDDDAGAGGGPAACATAAYTSIQDAIDASPRWSTVNVCPGTYAEQLVLGVKGIRVQSKPPLQAHLVAPPVVAPVDGVRSVARLTAWAARLVGFSIDIFAGDVAGTMAVTSGGAGGGTVVCTHVDVAVLVLGQRARVRRNVIDSTGNATLSGACGYSYGIVFGQHDLSPTALPAPFGQLSVGRAVLNQVRDFKMGGILVEGAAYKVRVDQNTISYLHEDDPGCTVETFAPCVGTVALPSLNINDAFLQAFGIGAEDDASAWIEHNAVTSDNVLGPSGPPPLGWGVALNGASNASIVHDNQITGVSTGVQTVGNTDVPASVGVGGAQIYNNVVFGSTYGFDIKDNGHDIHDNLASGGAVGMWASGVENWIHDNDFIGVTPNTVYDCWDTSPAGSHSEGTSNYWEDDFNAGATSSPMDLCHAP